MQFTNMKDKLAAARLAACHRFSYFRVAIMQMVPVEAPGLGTFATTRDSIMLWDPEFLRGLDMDEAVGVVLHECVHILRKHADRCEAHHFEPKAFNWAGDAEINDDLLLAKLKLPGQPVLPSSIGAADGLTAEEYYRHMLQQREQEKQQQQQQQRKGQGKPKDKSQEPKDKSQEPQGGQGEGDEKEEEEDGQEDGEDEGGGGGGAGQDDADHGGSGEGEGSGGEDAEGEGSGEGSGESDGDGLGHGHCGSCAGRAHPKEAELTKDIKGRTPREIEGTRRAVAEAIRQEASKGPGTVPGSWTRWADTQLAPPKVPWQQKLARAVRNAVAYRAGSVDLTHSRISRRQAGLGFGPGRPVISAMHAPQPRVAVVVDTSGSMGDAELRGAISECKGILAAVGAAVEFCACDAKVHELRPVRSWQDAVKLLKGGGGTDFAPAFEALEKKNPRPDVVVFITDGQGPAPQMAPPFRVIWTLVGSYRQRPPVTWGEVIEVAP
jgi:predicted metal-dependent peptidase